MTRPFLSVITRTHYRPTGLREAISSLVIQTCQDAEQVFIIDHNGNHPEGNIKWANGQFETHKDRADGLYIFPLDDDGEIIAPDFIETAKRIAYDNDLPDVLLVKSLTLSPSGSLYTLPLVWNFDWELGERPPRWSGHGYNVIVRHDWYKSFVPFYNQSKGGDWHFVTSLINHGATFVRLPHRFIACSSLSRGKGKRFQSGKRDPNWFSKIARHFGIIDLGNNDWRLQLWKR
jgi:glycosyltransferase involved in cell wall biosynthesis